MRARFTFVLALSAGWAACTAVRADQPPPRGAEPIPVYRTTLRIAESIDGITFRDTGQVLCLGAANPKLTLLPRGRLLAYFEHAPSAHAAGRTWFSATYSDNAGNSWSALRRVRLDGLPERTEIRGLDLVISTAGGGRFFVSAEDHPPVGDHQAQPRHARVVPAVTKDGLNGRVDHQGAILLPLQGMPSISAVFAHDTWRVYASETTADQGTQHKERRTAVYESTNGRNFGSPKPAHGLGNAVLTSLVVLDEGLRCYAKSEKGIQTAVSEDGLTWSDWRPVGIADGWAPSVVQLHGQKYLMVYCAEMGHSAAVSAPTAGTADGATGQVPNENDGGTIARVPLVGQYFADDWAELAESDPSIAQRLMDGAIPGQFPGDMDFDTHWVEAAPADVLTAPRPDFENNLNYFDWYRSEIDTHPVDNAYDDYAQLLGPDELPIDAEALQKNMFSDPDFSGPPGPWNPELNPEWEEAHQAIQWMADLFQRAGQRTGYAHPGEVSEEFVQQTPGQVPLLLSMKLPHLGVHRSVAKALISDGWRAEHGQVSTDHMLDTWDTVLKNADHMARGSTLIEQLVGSAERSMVYSNALQALQQNIFSDDDIETALNTLAANDHGPFDPARSIRGEHAVAMETMQYIFTPGDAESRFQRASLVMNLVGEKNEDSFRKIAEMTPEDIRNDVDNFDRYYEELAGMMQAGYPQVRRADVEALHEKYANQGTLGRHFLPALSRVHVLRAREEATRRATQLSYALQLFERRNGRWPDSLDELPAMHRSRFRTDPFTGNDFGYALDANGPRIYTLGENQHDDGGIHPPKWDDQPDPATGSDDHVFWPPQP